MNSFISSLRNISLLPTLVIIRHKHSPDELSECELGLSMIARHDSTLIESIQPMEVGEEYASPSDSLFQMSIDDADDDRTDSIPFPRSMICDSPDYVIIYIGCHN